MRIISGKFKGKNLVSSIHLKDLKPTTDKNRELLFSLLSAAKFSKEINFKIENSIFLDLCCGSGAVGFEAISRGAKKVFFIDKNKTHLELVKKNAQILKVEENSPAFLADAKKINKNLFRLNLDLIFEKKNQESDFFFDAIFLDPPYAEDYSKIIQNIIDQSLMNEKTLLIVESKFDKIFQKKTQNHHQDNIFHPQLKLLHQRKSSQTIFSFLQLIQS
jgi:16S rRNA (guanine966-N2)-methyltransferase